jgi:osmoprotectant transport system permease protein
LIGLSILIVAGGGGWGIKQLTAPTVVNITIAGKLGSEPDILINMYKLMIEAKTTRVHVTLKPNFGQTTFLYRALKAKKNRRLP